MKQQNKYFLSFVFVLSTSLFKVYGGDADWIQDSVEVNVPVSQKCAYSHLCLEDRKQIEAGLNNNQSMRSIAQSIGKSL